MPYPEHAQVTPSERFGFAPFMPTAGFVDIAGAAGVVGPGTAYPIGLEAPALAHLYWRPFRLALRSFRLETSLFADYEFAIMPQLGPMRENQARNLGLGKVAVLNVSQEYEVGAPTPDVVTLDFAYSGAFAAYDGLYWPRISISISLSTYVEGGSLSSEQTPAPGVTWRYAGAVSLCRYNEEGRDFEIVVKMYQAIDENNPPALELTIGECTVDYAPWTFAN